jgi:hypothetical protein
MSRREKAKNWPDIRTSLERMVGDMVPGLRSSGPLIQKSEMDLENLVLHIRTDRQPILRPQGKDSSLRQWGLHLASRGGKQARNKAVVALARKLSVLLHRIWITQEPYVPFYAKAA